VELAHAVEQPTFPDMLVYAYAAVGSVCGMCALSSAMWPYTCQEHSAQGVRQLRMSTPPCDPALTHLLLSSIKDR
jgi:hypothetical protein